jgi:hypothetical protein
MAWSALDGDLRTAAFMVRLRCGWTRRTRGRVP